MRLLTAVPAALAALAACVPSPVPDPDAAAEPGGPAWTQVTSGKAGEDRDPDLSPDGTRLFYASSAFGPDLDLYVRPVGANSATRLTQWPGHERFPKPNPAAPQTLAFCSNRDGTWRIYVMPDCHSRPGEASPVSPPALHALHPSWSKDGRRLAFSAAADPDAGPWTLHVLDVATGAVTALEDVDGLLPEWSPAGNRLVFQRMRRRDDWHGSLWTVELSGTSALHVTSLYASEDMAAINPAWSPDGRRIAFATAGPGGGDLWVVDADGAHAARLTSAGSVEGMPAWGADGRIYFVSDRGGSARIWSLDPGLR